MPKQRQLSNRVSFNQALAPVSKSAGTTTSSAIDLTGYSNASLFVSIGVISSSGTVDCKVQASATSGGSYADITGAAITQATQAGGDSGSQSSSRSLCHCQWWVHHRLRPRSNQ